MPSPSDTKPWDLSHVLGLINTLSVEAYSGPLKTRELATPSTPQPTFVSTNQDLNHSQIDKKDFATLPTSLGDFSRIYQFLGTPPSSPAPASWLSSTHVVDSATLPLCQQYASDGATYVKPHLNHGRHGKKEVVYSADETVTDTVSDGSIGPGSPTLTKKQRKNLRKKERKEAQKRQRSLTVSHLGGNIVSESEADMNNLRTPARKASAHFSNNTTNNPKGLPQNDHSQRTPRTLYAARTGNTKVPQTQLTDAISHGTSIKSDSKLTHNLGTQKASAADNYSSTTPTQPPQRTTPVAHVRQNRQSTMSFLPASLPPKPHTPKASFHQHANDTNDLSIKTPNGHVASKTSYSNTLDQSRAIEPMTVRSGEDRNWTLLMKLIGDFWTDRKYLISPMNLTTHNNDPKGIHVFVDASNIFIGFNEQLKRSRGIPTHIHVPSVGLSFDALALLMERRRPVAKRVLVGSMPLLPAFDKAKQVGYECSILEKVYKARELTQRQVYFKELDERASRKRTKVPPANNVALANGSYDGNGGNTSGSVSETNAPQYAPARMIEQGVDEILHLKILESVVDADEPGTMVLATGDAAQAEYSEGFMAMTERALKKGWAVELVSWSANISTMYRKRTWTEAWGERFRIVLLDDYAEELLDM